jgi:hypothetical protein
MGESREITIDIERALARKPKLADTFMDVDFSR